MSVKERLKIFAKYKNLSERKFCESVGLSSTYISAMRVSIQPDKLSNIAKQYPELNTGWILTGEGEMLKPTHKQYAPVTGDEKMLNYLMEENAEYRKTIGYQAESINKMQDQILDLQRKLDEKGLASVAPGAGATCANAG